MDIKIFALFVFVAVLGSFTEARSAFNHLFGNGGSYIDRSHAMPRWKREIGESNGETTTTTSATTQASTTPASTDPTTTPPTSTDTTTTPSTESTTTPSTTTTEATSPTTTTEATSPTTTPITTTTSVTTPTTLSDKTSPTTPSDDTTPTTTPDDATTPTTTESTKPTSTKKPTNDLPSRSNFDEPESEDTTKKPGSPKDDKTPTPGPYFGPGATGFGFDPFGPGFYPYYGYPGFNSIPGSGPNYAWTGTNNGPGYASAGASAGSYAGAYPMTGTGYPMTGFPTADSPSLGSRGEFQDNSPNPSGYNYGGVDPLYNGGFYYPGQFPNYNNQAMDMIRQIQAQIQAQHQASMAFHANQAGSFASNPNYSYSSANMNNMRPRPTFGDSYGSGVGDSNMDFPNRFGGYDSGSYGDGVQYSSASIGLGPQGGFQMGQISPAAPGIESRFSEDLPAPSGNSFGVFASSSSSSMTGPDGRPINHKTSITGVNDNGKVSFRTVHD